MAKSRAASKVIGGAIKPSEQEIRKLVGFYRESVERIARNFFNAVDFERPRLFSILQENLAILDKLDSRAETWANRNIAKLYKAVQRGTAKDLAELGLSKSAVAGAANFAVVNQEAIEALLWDPQVGVRIVPAIGIPRDKGPDVGDPPAIETA